ncbi:CRISPR-associated protein Cas1 [Haloferax gibbonsii ATCC 33959]|uniref:CRISPR-associated protein Cas1 n=1 Tax=Haloferax gibbonsii (strain ATCC 33959 / DSM 4427 / JCM 8863 / NBRC 102184 / NCIMB 2188 / Ma 2.38) TaxID=1227459 RepID=M0HMY5_HALGM|nr:CRISPR-associated protein Cas1 [Haloferax gibbonsii ATCC 33959]
MDRIEERLSAVPESDDVNTLRGIEGSIRSEYYSLFREVTPDSLPFIKREFRPPPNEVNSLISFGNSLLYSAILTEIYSTHLDPTISYLHEPAERRYSLCLDLSELFKPLIVDRLIFRLLNRKQITEDDFDSGMNGCLLTTSGRRLFVREFEETLERTVEHPTLKRHVSYQYLLRLEAYKLHKHVIGDKEYEPFKRWW